MIRQIVLFGMAGTLTACALTSSPPEAATPGNWVEFGNTVRSYDQTQLDSEYLIAAETYRSAPTDATAIRLALLAADSRGRYHDSGRALMLFDEVIADAAAEPTDVEFARFMHGWIADLVDVEAELAEAVDDRESLQGRLDALVELERRLNTESLE